MKFGLLILSINLPNTPDTSFFERVLNDYERYSFYITLNINSPEYEGPVVIENDDLFFYLSLHRLTNKHHYKKLIRKKIETGKALHIHTKDLNWWQFIKVYKFPSIDSVAEGGADAFLKTYQHGITLQVTDSIEEEAALISKLFSFRIPVCRDDETGYLIIYE